MNSFSFFKTNSRPRISRRGRFLFVVGVMIGVAAGGVGVSRASGSQTITFCVNKKTQVVRLAKAGRCARTESRLAMNAEGVAGATGPAGPSGVPGQTGATGATGPAGAAGPAGPQGIQGPAGPQGIQGLQGVQGAAGVAGTRWTFAGQGFFGLGGSSTQRATGYTSGYDATDGVERFRVICWVESNIPKHVVEYDLNAGENVISTAHTIGGTATSTSRVSSAGTVDIGSVRSVDTRHEIMVLGPSFAMSQYEIVVTATVSECRVSFASHG